MTSPGPAMPARRPSWRRSARCTGRSRRRSGSWRSRRPPAGRGTPNRPGSVRTASSSAVSCWSTIGVAGGSEAVHGVEGDEGDDAHDQQQGDPLDPAVQLRFGHRGQGRDPGHEWHLYSLAGGIRETDLCQSSGTRARNCIRRGIELRYMAVPGRTGKPVSSSPSVGRAHVCGGPDGPGAALERARGPYAGSDSLGVSKLPGTSTSMTSPVTRTANCRRGVVGLPEITVPSRANWPSWQWQENCPTSGSQP